MTLRSAHIDADLVRRLVAAQFPQWAALPIRPVAADGWDNRTFHLGDQMTARLPSAEAYSSQVAKEHRWLPALSRRLPVPIPVPLALGRPGEGYPWNWSVYAWLNGETARTARIDDARQYAVSLAGFLLALQRIDASGAPQPGPHNGYRGGPLAKYDAETRDAVAVLGDSVDAEAAIGAWQASLAAPWDGPPVWLHGDFSPGNLLVQNGRLSAVIDFGCCAVGDPACDLAIAWTVFNKETRDVFRAALMVDRDSWLRGRGWALWKALIVLAGLPGTDPSERKTSLAVLEKVLADQA